jgi:tRNA 2-selenouridine synthase
MAEALSSEEFLSNSREGKIIDVRTPAEFEKGHIPGAFNIPLFTNDQRAVVGTIYKRQGKEKAVIKGLEFVGPEMKNMVLKAKKISGGDPLYVHCWRGGMRSASMAWLFETTGIKCYTMKGGYKAYRRSFHEMLENDPRKFIVIAGPTGSGKTAILDELSAMGEQVLDLEGLAHHKGSAFGALGEEPQPTNEQFENDIHHVLRPFSPDRPVWVEGESRSIGKNFIPDDLFDMLVTSDTVHVYPDFEYRVKRLVVDYAKYPKDELIHSFEKISKRLGGLRTKNAVEAVRDGEFDIAVRIGLEYYDKTYQYAIDSRTGRKIVIETGSQEPAETARYLKESFYSGELLK